jgi:hypothetical protein
MSTAAVELTEAYRQEEKLYLRILELVEQQGRIMEQQPDPAGVTELCCEVERLLERIAAIERDIAPAKSHWEGSAREISQELDDVLASIQSAIERTAEKQDEVRRKLMQYLRSRRGGDGAAGGRTAVRRARQAYQAT